MTLQQLLHIPLPIIQAPMAGVQDHALAAAVSEAGGLGSLPCATLGPEEMRRQLTALRQKTSKPFNVNFFCHAEPVGDEGREAAWRSLLAPYFLEFGVDPSNIAAGPKRLPFNHDAADVVCDLKPAVVSFHFGLPSAELLQRVRGCGAKILSTATNVAEAKWLEARGVDAIIAQGSEAGGHRGIFLSKDLNTQTGTLALVPQVVAAVKVPVIAAGGIADARGVAAAMALGAAGVQVGTAYLLCTEATTGPLHRAALKSDARLVTAVTNVFTGRPARGIVNRLIRELKPINGVVPEFPLAASMLAALRAKAEGQGRDDFSSMWAGQNTSGCREVSAGVITQELAAY